MLQRVPALIAALPPGARDGAGAAWRDHGEVVICKTREEAVELADRYAPEHLELLVRDAPAVARRVQHAGAIFVGAWTPEAAGDYLAGPNHVLPTSGAARLRGGLSAADFMKVIAVQELSREGLAKLTPAITELARAEGLEAHARSAEVRGD